MGQAVFEIMPNDWVIADSHWGHFNIIQYCHRPDGAEERIFRDWHKKVKHGDRVVHLGDVAFIKADSGLRQRIHNLPGQKFLLMGNHDHQTAVMGLGFKIIATKTQIVHAVINGQKIILSHRPYTSVPEGTINIHGHIHNNPYPSELRTDHSFERWRNVSVEVMDYKLERLGDILEHKLGNTPAEAGYWLDKHDPEHLRSTQAKTTGHS